MNIPAIILAGGLGTRLQSVVKDIPKPMAEVAGRPFLDWLLDDLHRQGIREVILSVGYRQDVIRERYGNTYRGMAIRYSSEDKPLGTGGALRQAMAMAGTEALVLNGDTFFQVNLAALYSFYQSHAAAIAIALKPMQQVDRYGTVTVNEDRVITSFNEKTYCENGLINGGVYVVSAAVFADASLPEVFSFEQEVLHRMVQGGRLFGFPQPGYFIDIGIPEDYTKAQDDFSRFIH
jgi:D-glycero-alpha-D-manno-heptose 1-phosphate guanylyltransferase